MDTETFFYIAGGGLCLVALIISFVGMRSESFPPSKKVVLGGLTVVFLVVATACAGAVLAAREEQKHRRAELAQAAGAEAVQEGAEAPATEEPAPETPAPEEPAAEEPAAPAEPETASIDAAGLFVSNGCGSCHTLGVAGSEAAVGPNLDDVLPGQSAGEVLESIVDPSAQLSEGFGDGIMPTGFGTAMTAPELDALVDYMLKGAG